MGIQIKKYQDGAGFFFVVAVAILTVISILGVWDIFGIDVITKSIKTLGLVALVTAIIVISGRFVRVSEKDKNSIPEQPSQAFLTIRRATLGVLIISVVFLALIGVLSIWEVITERETLHKSISSIAILLFSSFAIVAMCLEREGWGLRGENKKSFSVASVILTLFLLLIMLSIFGFFIQTLK